MRGAHVLRTIRQVGVENMDGNKVGDCLLGACGAGMALSLISTLVGTHGANVDAVNDDGQTALMLAAEHGHTVIVNALAGTHGANVNAVNAVNAVNRGGMTALMLAAEHGHTDTERAGRDARGQCGCCR